MCYWGITILFFQLIAGPLLHSDQSELTDQYIETYKFLAIDEMHRTGIPASIILAQAIVESNSGTSELATRANNHFGIKCKHYWQGATYYYEDDDLNEEGDLIESCFRKYRDIETSYVDHSDFLVNTIHYRPLFRYERTDFSNWARGLKECGYATDQKYSEKLIRTIKNYALHELDYYVIKYE